jgi:putative membrane protein
MRRSFVCVALLAMAACAWLTAPALAQQPSKVPLLTPQQFVAFASETNLAEMDMAKMAQKNSNNSDVQRFAEHMIHDHAMLNKNLERVAAKLGFHVATEIPKKDRKQAEKLTMLKGKDFNHEYAKDQVTDHKKVIAIFERQAKEGQNPELRKLAAEALPILKEHLKLAEKLPGAMTGATSTGH